MASFGITSLNITGVVCESMDFETKADFKQLIASDGTFFQAKSFDLSSSFSARGKGDTNPFTLGGGSGFPDMASGKCIITSIKRSTKNDDFYGWEATGVAYPYAS